MKYTFVGDEIIAEGKWPKTKRGALNESIKKWKELVLHLENNDSIPEATVESCALCQLYYDFDTLESWGKSECKGCPVAEKTGKGECTSTPFIDYYETYIHGKALRAARREVRFLESLK